MKLGVNGRFYGARATGVQRFAREITARLVTRADVTLFLPRNVTAPSGPDLANGCPVVRGILPGRAWEHIELPRAARTHGCDVVLHLSNTGPTWGGPHVVTVYDVTPLTNPEWYAPLFVWWFRVALARAARQASYLLTLSEWARSEVHRVLGVPTDRIGVVSQGVEPFDRPAPDHLVEQVRRKWNLPGPFVLAVGAGRRKNLDFLVRLSEQFRHHETLDIALVVVGAGYRRVHGTDSSLKPSDRVRYVGHVSDEELHALYTAAGALCFPSYSEGFGRPPLEAMACGTPALVADYGPAAEVLGEAALILPLDLDAWLDGLQRLLSEEELRADMIRRGLACAARYRWDPAVDQIVSACERVTTTPAMAAGAAS